MTRLVLLGLLACASIGVAAEIPPQDRRSGFEFMSPQTQAMQSEETSNPGMLWVADGERLWSEPQAPAGKSCASCHAEATKSMGGVAARYPAFDEETKRPIDLMGRINQCRAKRQGAASLTYQSDELLALTAYVANQSHGMPITPPADSRLEPFRENGRAWFERRLGQLQLSCAACHDDRWGARLGGSVIPQGHPTGYPLYRLEWQNMGSLQRRLRGCLVGVRAQPFDFGAPEYVDIELFLMERARGLTMETPAVRP
ncbi:sulfur oxidation c-type cytochrome SoxA [Steroidobacter agaridevorans]|uniref:sulfur oxidation c-type cytochrome SoxA n=1 Tax=Steroidobacter agaridevorans TaxID=2695856 RepID=UPI001322CE58|nr:sulfur oxidation c-type cytochrome SoxA [Steroidobacter agaridevorans]GFE87367.1 SoxAX cytochrome complex subunit A [Steroidobacter agaridevorans]